MSIYKTKSVNIGNYKTIIVQNQSLNSSCIGCIIKCGSTNDNKGKSGICSLINYMLLNSKNANNIISKGERIGFTIKHIFCREYTYLYIHTYSHLYYEATELLIELINNFSFTEEDIQNAKKYIKNKIMYEQDNIDAFILNAIHENIFTRQLIGKTKYGKTKTIDSITYENVQNFCNRYYNYKNIVMIISSSSNIDDVQEKFSSMNQFNTGVVKYAFSSFKRYIIHRRIKYIYKNTKNTYINIIFPMSGFRSYEKKTYANLLVKILSGHTKSILHSDYDVKLIEYNSVSMMLIKFQLCKDQIMDCVKEILKKLSNLQISEETYTEIIKHMVSENISVTLNSIQSTYQFALHYLNLRKIKKHNFDLEILYSFNKSKIQEDFKNIFQLDNMSLIVFGPKYNKHQILSITQ
jgi:predicted Zn-dependent peptidase